MCLGCFPSSCRMHELHELHWKVAKRIFLYNRRTHRYGIQDSFDGNENLVGYSNFDCDGDLDDHKYTYGYVFHLGSNKYHPAITLSSRCHHPFIKLPSPFLLQKWSTEVLLMMPPSLFGFNKLCSSLVSIRCSIL
jgi:hypothetical protein